jgi:signal transduction histidine kinase
MKRSWPIWIAFGVCLAVVLAAMGWISLKALGLERAEIEARRLAEEARRLEALARQEAALEQDVQLALYRMEFALTPLVARESARPYVVYNTFLPAPGVYGPYGEGAPETLATSPLLKETSPDVRVHFQFDAEGRLTSPRVPDPAKRPLVVPQHLSQEAVDEAQRELARVAAIVDRGKLLSLLPESTPELAQVVVVPLGEIGQQRLWNEEYQQAFQQRGRDAAEFGRRSHAFRQSANTMLQNQAVEQLPDVRLPSPSVDSVLMTRLWVDGELLLARRVRVGEQEVVQGCLLDWPAIKQGLLIAIEDLLPEAHLEPVADGSGEEESRRLAALPVRLIPGLRAEDAALVPGMVRGWRVPAGAPTAPPTQAEPLLSPIRLSLVVAWGCVLLAAVAVALLLAGVIRLSDRRAAFVSAVTHELRTPLTTFHMYTEMLAEGMVPDQERQQEYLGTLRSEASRLSHLVENVLSYARLERGRTAGRVEDVDVKQLLEPIRARLADRARQDGMEIVVEGDEEAFSTVIRANTSAVEQILLNLVDNAGKYAQTAADKRIHLGLQRTDAVVELRVRDHGPGISDSAARRLFHSFSKSAHEAANSAPGVGLGLALSRRLARDMGGRLWLDKTVADGACFVLVLPVVGG